MPCCQKTRKAKIKQLMKRRIFETEGFSTLKRLRRSPPPALQEQLLLAHHKKTHELYKKAVTFKPANKALVHQIVQLHGELSREILKRGIIHKTPLQTF